MSKIKKEYDDRFFDSNGELLPQAHELCKYIAQFEDPWSQMCVIELRFGDLCFLGEFLEMEKIKKLISKYKKENIKSIDIMVDFLTKQKFNPTDIEFIDVIFRLEQRRTCVLPSGELTELGHELCEILARFEENREFYTDINHYPEWNMHCEYHHLCKREMIPG